MPPVVSVEMVLTDYVYLIVSKAFVNVIGYICKDYKKN